MKPPSERQLNYIRDLGYGGRTPETIEETSVVIACLKNGRTPSQAEALMRLTPMERTLVYVKEYIRNFESQGTDKPAGWRMKVPKGAETENNQPYKDAFLPFEVGNRHPELLILGSPNIVPGDDDEQRNLYVEVSSLQRRPSNGQIVVAPGIIEEIQPKSRKTQTSRTTGMQTRGKKGCAMLFMSLVVVTAFVLLLTVNPCS